MVALDRDGLDLSQSEALDICNGIPMAHVGDGLMAAENDLEPSKVPVEAVDEQQAELDGQQPESWQFVIVTVAWVIVGFMTGLVVSYMVVKSPWKRVQAGTATEDEEKHGFLASREEDRFALAEDEEAVNSSFGLVKPPEFDRR